MATGGVTTSSTSAGRETTTRSSEQTGSARVRTSLYHFLEIASAHPGEGAFDYLTADATETLLLDQLARLRSDAALVRAVGSLRQFFSGLRAATFEAAEAAHISLFSANFPVVPCPPYGSLFTVEEAKRRDEMLAIKQAYRSFGIDLSPAYDDLPDHLCVELEVMQVLSFREAEVGDALLAEKIRAQQRMFLDRFLVPLAEALAGLAGRHAADNPYSHLLEATRQILAHHRGDLADHAKAERRAS